jgi:hypothetical protein
MFFLRNIDVLLKPDGSFHSCGRIVRGSGKQRSATLLLLAQKQIRSVRDVPDINTLPWGLHNDDKLQLQRCAHEHCRHCVDGQPPVVFSLTHRGAARTPSALWAARKRWENFQQARGETGEGQQREGPCRLLCAGCDADRKSGRLLMMMRDAYNSSSK